LSNVDRDRDRVLSLTIDAPLDGQARRFALKQVAPSSHVDNG
jgi:hypothetical protein